MYQEFIQSGVMAAWNVGQIKNKFTGSQLWASDKVLSETDWLVSVTQAQHMPAIIISFNIKGCLLMYNFRSKNIKNSYHR